MVDVPPRGAAASDFSRRIEQLTAIHSSLLTELSFGKAHGDGLLTPANIVFNEAGVASRPAKVAVAYAWLNRTGGKKSVSPREAPGARNWSRATPPP